MVRPGALALPSAAALALLGSLLLCSAGSLALPISAEGQPGADKGCILAGTWVNDLGSTMTISATSSAGEFSGTYQTKVSVSSQPVELSRLWGSQHLPSQHAQPTFGFTVKWVNGGSVTVFVGQCFVDASGKETLKTLWLLRKEATDRTDDWKSTLVGWNVFVRAK